MEGQGTLTARAGGHRAAGEKTLTDEQFATISVNVLHQTLIEVSRTVGKRIFRELEAGTRVALTQLRMEDGGIYHYWQEMVLILKLQKKLWI